MGLKAMLYALHESPYSGKQQLIHIAIAEAVNNETMIGFISQEAIAKAAKCSIETVRLTVKRMVESGHLKIVQEARQHRATVYQIVIPAAQVPPSSKGADQTQPPNPQAPAPKSTGSSPQVDRPSPQISLGTPGIYTRPDHPSSSLTAAFDEFWQAYPRKQDKGSARKAWTKAIKAADVAEIIAGAERYRDDPNRDPGFTKLPATWLNAEAWDNDPLPERSGVPPKPPSASRMFADAAMTLATLEIAQ